MNISGTILGLFEDQKEDVYRFLRDKEFRYTTVHERRQNTAIIEKGNFVAKTAKESAMRLFYRDDANRRLWVSRLYCRSQAFQLLSGLDCFS
jgi:hypothetical protein